MTCLNPCAQRLLLTTLALSALLLAGGCGREAPATPPDPELPDSRLSVDSTPQGAAILLNGVDTGEVTPHEFRGLPEGEVVVSVELPGYLVSPASVTRTVADGVPVDVPAETFTTRSLRLVILEGFANIDCGPCPQLTANFLNLTVLPEYGPDRVAFVEYAVFWPNFQDPFYKFNDVENDERIQTYSVPLAPTLIVDGDRQESAVDFELLRGAVDAALVRDPGVLVDVVADLSGTDVPVTVTIIALRDVDLTGHTLYVAIFQNALTIEPSPGTNGQTEFHHIFRDRVDALPSLDALTTDQQAVFELDVLQGAWGADATTVYAFIQNDTDRSVLQAGSTAQTALAGASLFLGQDPADHRIEEGNLP